jgi:hypothetical protein
MPEGERTLSRECEGVPNWMREMEKPRGAGLFEFERKMVETSRSSDANATTP